MTYLDYELTCDYLDKGKYIINAINHKKEDFLVFYVYLRHRRQDNKQMILQVKNHINKHVERGY